MSQINSNTKDDFQVVLLLSCFVGHPVYQHSKSNFHSKNIIWLKFTINLSLFKLNYNWRHCSAIYLTVVMLCLYQKARLCMCDNGLVCKALRLAFSCQTSAISLLFILIPWLVTISKVSSFKAVNKIEIVNEWFNFENWTEITINDWNIDFLAKEQTAT